MISKLLYKVRLSGLVLSSLLAKWLPEQLEGMDAGSEELDNTLKDMLGTLVQFL